MHAQLQQSATRARLNRYQVLVVDDRRDVATAFAELCRSEGYAAEVSVSARHFDTLLHRLQPAAIIMDVMMPDADGYEALKVIAMYDANLPVLLISGYGETSLRMAATLGLAHGLMALRTAQKPVGIETVRGFLAEITADRGD